MNLEKLKNDFIKVLETKDAERVELNNKCLEEAGETWRDEPLNYKQALFIRGNDLILSGECGLDTCDYYGEYRGGYPWINEALEEAAASAGYYWEWENAGCCILYKA